MRVMKGLLGLLLAMPLLASAEEVGQVSTVFKFVGPNDRIVVEALDDPKVDGVTCYLSRAKTGGVKGGLGLAEGHGAGDAERKGGKLDRAGCGLHAGESP